jgi:(p)ppGpp synthase/HD superfamily hydrolase
MSKLEQAIELATRLHAGQVDKAGEDYIHHPLRVMNAVNGETEKIVAVLHDTLEDTPVTLAELEHLFGEAIASAVNALSRSDGEDYFEFIERVKQNSIAVTVKIADLQDNMNLSRIATITERDRARQKKYQKALSLLITSEPG